MIIQFEITQLCPEETGDRSECESPLPLPIAVWVDKANPASGLRCGSPAYPILYGKEYPAIDSEGRRYYNITAGPRHKPTVCEHMGRFIE